MARKAEVNRKTTETDITLKLNLDGQGEGDIKTPIPFFTHMLTNMARHGLLDQYANFRNFIEKDSILARS